MFPGDGNSEVAVIEFNSRDEALVAQTRDQKSLDGFTIEVQIGTCSTLFVTNFPPEADENYIRGLFREVSCFCPSFLPLCHIALLTFGSMAKSSMFASHRLNIIRTDVSVTCNSRLQRQRIAPRSWMGLRLVKV